MPEDINVVAQKYLRGLPKDEEDRKRALALGANAYITKPIRAPQVIQTVRQLLNV